MQTILAVDQSYTNTGICVVDIVSPIYDVLLVENIISHRVSENYIDDSMQRTHLIGSRLNELIDEFKPEYIVFESLSLASMGNATRTLPMLLGGLLAHIHWYLSKQNVSLVTVAPTTLKKFATGKGNANKVAMLAAIEEHDKEIFHAISNRKVKEGRYDISDAYWLSQWVIHNKIGI